MTCTSSQWPAKISAELLALVEETFQIRGVISTLPSAEVSARDMALLRPNTWLNDEVINFYGVMVNIRSAAAKARKEKGKAQMLEGDEDLLDVHVFSSHFFSKLANSGYSGVRKWSKKVSALLESV
jgi:sentrin-specific protease 1